MPEWPTTRPLRGACARCAASTRSRDRRGPRAHADVRRRARAQGAAHRRRLVDDWIRELEISVRGRAARLGNLARAAQLLNKTNQMNLCDAPPDRPSSRNGRGADGHASVASRVADRFGDSGSPGIVGSTSTATRRARRLRAQLPGDGPASKRRCSTWRALMAQAKWAPTCSRSRRCLPTAKNVPVPAGSSSPATDAPRSRDDSLPPSTSTRARPRTDGHQRSRPRRRPGATSARCSGSAVDRARSTSMVDDRSAPASRSSGRPRA